MSAEFVVYSPLSPSELEQVENTCLEHIAGFYEEHDDAGEQWGAIALGGEVPSADEATALARLPDDSGPSPRTRTILSRLETIRSAITIERPGDLDVDRMQVSILRFLVARAGAGLVRLGDRLDTSEAVLAELKGRQGAEGFDLGDEPVIESPELDDLDEEEEEEPTSPMIAAVRGLIAQLRSDELLDVTGEFDIVDATEAVLRALERFDRRAGNLAPFIADTLLEVEGVEELYADDATLELRVRDALSGV